MGFKSGIANQWRKYRLALHRCVANEYRQDANEPISGTRATARAASRFSHAAIKSGERLDPHMHREAQLVFAAKGVMQVQTPRGVWLVPPERAVWVPPRLEHAIDVLSDIEMRTVYFQPRWLAKQRATAAIANEFVVRVGALMREAILAMFEPQCDAARKLTLAQLVVMDLRDAGDASTFMPMPAARQGAPGRQHHPQRSGRRSRPGVAGGGSRNFRPDADAAVSRADQADAEVVEAARPRDRGDRTARPARRLDQAGRNHARLLVDRRLQLRVSRRDRRDADGVSVATRSCTCPPERGEAVLGEDATPPPPVSPGRTGSPAAAGRDFRAASCPHTPSGRCRAAAAPARPCRRSRRGRRAGTGT